MKKHRSLFFAGLIGYLAYCSIYIARLNFSVASALMETSNLLNKSQIGIIGGVFSFIYAAAKVPNGYFGDRYSAKKFIVLGLLITGASNVLIGIFTNFASIAFLWGVNAFGQSMLWGPLLRTFSENYEDDIYKKVSQLLISSVSVGSILGLLLAGECTAWGSVELCFLIPGIVVFVVALIVQCFFHDAQGRRDQHKGNLALEILKICRRKTFRYMMLPAVAHGMIKENINVWLVLYFVDTFSQDPLSIVKHTFFVPILTLVGRLLYPPMHRLLKNGYNVSLLSFAICGMVAVAIQMEGVTALHAMILLGTIAAVISMINTYMLTGFPSLFAEEGNLSLAAGLMDLLTYGGAGVGFLVFGVLVEHFGYNSMFLVWAILSILSAVLLKCTRSKAVLAVEEK